MDIDKWGYIGSAEKRCCQGLRALASMLASGSSFRWSIDGNGWLQSGRVYIVMSTLVQSELLLIFIHGSMVIVLRRIWFEGGDIRAVVINLWFNFIGELSTITLIIWGRLLMPSQRKEMSKEVRSSELVHILLAWIGKPKLEMMFSTASVFQQEGASQLN